MLQWLFLLIFLLLLKLLICAHLSVISTLPVSLEANSPGSCFLRLCACALVRVCACLLFSYLYHCYLFIASFFLLFLFLLSLYYIIIYYPKVFQILFIIFFHAINYCTAYELDVICFNTPACSRRDRRLRRLLARERLNGELCGALSPVFPKPWTKTLQLPFRRQWTNTRLSKPRFLSCH